MTRRAFHAMEMLELYNSQSYCFVDVGTIQLSVLLFCFPLPFLFLFWPCSGDVYRMQLRGYWKLKGDWRERIVSIQTILCRLMSSILESPRWYFSGWEWMHSSFMRWLPVTFSQQPFKVSIGVHQKTTW